jgi:hypothetical protein
MKTLTLAAVVVAVLASAGPVLAGSHFEGFETDIGDWQEYSSQLTRVSSGTTGISSAAGNYHLELTDPIEPGEDYYSGAYSFLGGSSTSFGNGWSSSADVYIDVADSRVATGGYGFDLSQAMYDTEGNHEQDNIFHVHSVDPEGDGTYDIYLNASHNTNGIQTNLASAGQPYGSSEPARKFIDSGWYTFQFDFSPSPDLSGDIEIDFSVIDESDNVFWHADWITEAYTITEAGGNGYMWFTFADTDRLAVDNVTMTVVPLPAAAWAGMVLMGAMGGVAGIKRKLRRD